jgi:hypothetical protein
MTASAGNSVMSPFELESGITIVIEIAGSPVRGYVAAMAIDRRPLLDLLCELPRMHVPMAIRAGGRKTPEFNLCRNAGCIAALVA